MKAKPILEKFEIKGIQNISTVENRALIEHRVPGMEGSLFQDLGTEPTLITLRGSLNYNESRQDVLNLEELRKKFQAAQAVPFVADITTATKVKEVLIKDIEIRESEKLPDYFDYFIELKEHVPEPPPSDVQSDVNEEAEERHDDAVKRVTDRKGRLEVEVAQEGAEEDYSKIEVQVDGTTEDGESFTATITDQNEGIYTLEDIPSGTYSAKAVRRE